jgi:hypothetical protein
MPAASLDVGPGGQVGVVWTSAHLNEVPDAYFAESTDGGATFGENHRTHPDTDGIQQYPAVAYDGLGVAHTFWEQSNDPIWDANILYAATGDGGASFTAPERVNDDPEWEINSQEKVAAAGLAGSGVVVVWMDGRQNHEDNVFFAGPAVSGLADDPRDADPGAGRGGPGRAEVRIVPTIARDGAAFRARWVRIVDAQGRLVRELGARGDAGAGAGWLRWDGRDDRGRRVEPGRYRALVGGPGGTEARGLVVVR